MSGPALSKLLNSHFLQEIQLPMEDYIGRELKIYSSKGILEGIMDAFDKDNGTVTIHNALGKHELCFSDITNVSLVENTVQTEVKPLKEADMYALLYEAFNVYGPFEDHFIFTIATSLKKFLRDFSTSSIKIIIDSDDVFGRIGLCFARLALGRVESISVELRCALNDLNSLRYKNAFENSGGSFDLAGETRNFSLTLFACNRNCSFEMNKFSSNQTIILDIPKSLPFTSFTGLGLGFIPENFSICNKSYYLLDVGFGPALCQKYSIPSKCKNSLIKMDVTR